MLHRGPLPPAGPSQPMPCFGTLTGLCAGGSDDEGDARPASRMQSRKNLERAETTVRARLTEQRYFPCVADDSDTPKLRLLRPFDDDSASLPAGAPASARHLPPEELPKLRWMLHPAGLPRQLWDTLATLLIYALVLLIPVEICFYREDDTWCALGTVP